MLILRSRFRWVACQLDLLRKCFNVRHLRQALASLPETLDDTYARILLNIDKEHNHYHREVLKILQWLTFSARPLQLKELAEIVAIDIDETPRFDPEIRWPEPREILMMCSSLITLTPDFYHSIDGESRCGFVDTSPELFVDMERASRTYVRLAHFSVKEYLVSDRIKHGIAARYSIREIESHGVVAGDCIAYLLHFDKPDSLRPETLKLFPLAEYAAEYWTDHARQAQKGPIKAVTCLSMELLMSGEGGLLNSVRIANPESLHRKDLGLGIGDVAPPLHYASMAGLSELVNMMIEKEADVNVKGGFYGNALQAASFIGNTATVKILLDNGADIDDAHGRYGTALCAFCYAPNYEIVELLLNKGADVNAYGEGKFDHGTALQIASERSCENIVKLLLDRGADVNATSPWDSTSPLESASLHGQENIAKMLLDKGADVNTQRAETSALQYASLHSYKNIVKMLLDKGADVNTQGRWGSALQFASDCGHESVVKILLENGANVNATCDKLRFNALQLASREGHQKIVEMLLEKGADVNAVSWRNAPTALQLASEKCHENNMNPEELLPSGILRPREAYEDIVKMLRAKGAVMPEEDYGN